MHATEHPGDACPEPTQATEGTADTATDQGFDLADPSRHPVDCPTCQALAVLATPAPVDGDGYAVTATGLRALTDTAGAPGTAGLVLRLAALYLQRHGWVQGAYYDPTVSVFTPAADMAGAIAMVCYGGPVDAPAQHFDDPGFLDFEEAMLHLDRYLLVADGSQTYEFNDAPGRRVEDVIRVLRQAADTPADELIDALRIVHADDARRARLFGGDGA